MKTVSGYQVLGILTIATVLLGAVFRSLGMFDGSISLWLDEADWAMKLSDLPLLEVTRIRPVGFMLVTDWLVRMGGFSEISLRILPWLGSLVSLPLMYLVSREIFRSPLAQLAAVFLLAFSPVLIDFAKEFKPYSLELCLHLLIMYGTIRAMKAPAGFVFLAIPLVALVGFFFAYNLVFLYPAVFLLLAASALASRQRGRAWYALVSALLLLAVIYGWYRLQWAGGDFGSREGYWGEKYDVFNMADGFSAGLQWYLGKYLGLLSQSTSPGVFVMPLTPVVAWLFAAAHAFGFIAVLVRKDWHTGLLICTPILLLLVFNMLGLWPFGPFRTNLFIIPGFILVTIYGIDTLLNATNRALRLQAGLVTVPIVFILQFPVDWERFQTKPRSSIRAVLEQVLSYHRDHGREISTRPVILADLHSYYPLIYYLRYDDRFARARREQYGGIDPLPVFIDGGLNRGRVEHLMQWPPPVAAAAPSYAQETGEWLSLNGSRRPDTLWYAISKTMVADRAEPFFIGQGEVIGYMNRFGDSNLLVRLGP